MNLRVRAILVSLVFVLVPGLLRAGGTVPKGTAISVITDQAVNSKNAKAGQRVSGSVAKEVTVGGKVLIPKGSAVKLTVSGVQASGRLSTPAKLYLHVVSVTVKGKGYTFATSSAGRSEKGKGKRDAGFIGGGAAGGAAIGALAGGGKGRSYRGRCGSGSRYGGGGRHGQKGHRVSRRDAAHLHHSNRRGHSIRPPHQENSSG